jgi:hypothetical protein
MLGRPAESAELIGTLERPSERERQVDARRRPDRLPLSAPCPRLRVASSQVSATVEN